MAHNGQPLTITIDVGLVRMVFAGIENVLREKTGHAIKTNQIAPYEAYREDRCCRVDIVF